jgi:hypothetical protein
MRQKLAAYGQWSYRGAWALEITAAFIGLTTGIAYGFKIFTEGGSFTAVIPVAALVMVSLAELTKIPVATLLYAARWIWKPVLLVFLLALAGITFLTVFQGLENSARFRQYDYDQLKQQIDLLKQDGRALEQAISRAKDDSQIVQAQNNVERISILVEKERTQLLKQIDDVDRELEGQVVLTPAAARARDVLKETEARRAALVEERDREIRDAVEQFERQRDSYVERLKNPSATTTPERIGQWENELRALVNPRTSIMARHQKNISAVDAEIAAARAEFERLRKTGEQTGTAQRRELEQRRSELVRTLATADERWVRQQTDARKAVSDAQTASAGLAAGSSASQARLEDIANKLVKLEAERIPIAREDQVLRIAARFAGKNPEDVTDSEAQFVAITWFGSLAMLAALAGPVMAIVALALQNIGLGQIGPSKLQRLTRNLLLRWRWKRVRTQKVPFEVLVEKEVEKPIEVPVEKIVKEILYVPILTDDPEAIQRALSETIPKEVADLVRISTAAKSHGRPT